MAVAATGALDPGAVSVGSPEDGPLTVPGRERYHLDSLKVTFTVGTRVTMLDYGQSTTNRNR